MSKARLVLDMKYIYIKNCYVSLGSAKVTHSVKQLNCSMVQWLASSTVSKLYGTVVSKAEGKQLEVLSSKLPPIVSTLFACCW